MSFVAVAVGGAGLLGAGASIYGANKAAGIQSEAANKAAALQGQVLDFQKGIYGNQVSNFADAKAGFGTTQNNLNPFIQSGIGANNLLSDAYGLNGSGPRANALAGFQNSPDYQFALKGGSDALDNSAASKGGLLGGNQIRAQTEYGQGLATQNLQNYFQRLSGMSQQGMNAAGTLGQQGLYLGNMGTTLGNGISGQIGTTANNMGNNIMAAGTAEGAGINGMVGGINSGIGNLLTAYKSSYGKGSPTGTVTPLSSYGGTGFSTTGTGGLY